MIEKIVLIIDKDFKVPLASSDNKVIYFHSKKQLENCLSEKGKILVLGGKKNEV